MKILEALATASSALEQGNAIKPSTTLVNVEAGTALIYALLSAAVELLTYFGLPVEVGKTDLHTIANGWSLTFSTIYATYRLATNPAAGVKSSG